MKKILFYLVISLLPAYALGQVVCPVPDMGQVAILFSADGASSIGEAEFSLAADTKVRFATGNLQYCPYQASRSTGMYWARNHPSTTSI